MSIPNTIQGMIHSVQRAERSRVADAELLRRYHQRRDEAAFTMIVDRYGGLVRATCLRTTSDTHHADDAYQATFLILARKASTIRRPEALPAWLVRVARHAALKRRQLPSISTEPFDTAKSPLDQLTAREFLTMFDEELDRLPVNYRSALLLCLVEGQTVEETARQLSTTHGTVRGWLQRGREKLRQRLSRRGLDLSAILPAVVLYYSTPASAAVQQSLLSMMNGSCVIPANISALMSGTFLTGMIGSLAVVVFLGVLLAGASLWPRTEEPPTAVVSTSQPPALMPIETDPARLPQDAIARIGSASFRHGGEVTALAFSKDNRYLASASPADFENSVRVWEMATGKEKLRVPVESNNREHEVRNRAVAVAFSEDSTQLRVLDWISYRAFDLANGKELVRHDFGVIDTSNEFFPKQRVVGTAFSPDGKTYAVVRGTGELVLGDSLTGNPRVTIAKSFILKENYSISRASITFSPDGKTICIPNEDKALTFDVETGNQLGNYTLEKDRIEKGVLTGSRELTCIVTGMRGGNPSLQVVDLSTNTTIHRSPLSAWDAIAASPDGKWLAIGNDGNQAILLLDRSSKKIVHRLPMLPNTACLAFSSDSRWLANSGKFSGCVTVWNVDTGAKHPVASQNDYVSARFEQDGLLTIETESLREQFHQRTWQKVSQQPTAKSPRVMQINYSPDRLLQADGGLEIIVSEVATGKEFHRFMPNDYCHRIVFTPDNRRLIGVTQQAMIHLWDLQTNKEIWSHQILPERALGLVGTGDPQLSQNGRWMAIASLLNPDSQTGYVIRVFDFQENKERAVIKAPYSIIGGICISPDGRLVAGGGQRQQMGQPEEEDVFVWDVSTGKRVNTLTGHITGINSHTSAEVHCQFTPDGRKLLAIDGKGTMRLWELSSGQILWKSPENHGAPRFSISPDGGVVASSSFDAPVLLWDLYGNAKGSVKPSGTVDLEQLWVDLASVDAGKAFKSIRQLCAVPDQAIKLLREKLTATKPRAEGAVAQWIKELSSPDFAMRERASRELLTLLDEVEPQLRQALAATTSDETRRRLDTILLNTGKASPDRLRQERGLDVLEHLGTKEAKQHLETLSKGGANTPLTLGAQAALARMASLKAQP